MIDTNDTINTNDTIDANNTIDTNSAAAAATTGVCNLSRTLQL